MNIEMELIGDINTFLSKNTVDSKMLNFLIQLKQKILDRYSEKEANGKKNITDVEKILRSIGKKAFIECYDIFKESRDNPNANIVSLMQRYGGANNEFSARTKASIGKKLFKEGLEVEALKNIIDSSKVEESIKNKALLLLRKEEKF